MAGNTDIFKQREVRQKSAPDYDSQTGLHGIISKNNYNFVSQIAKQTIGHLGEVWLENMYENMHLWNEHGCIQDLLRLGKNKATIGVGAGPSFNINKDQFKQVAEVDGIQEWEERDFIIIASNHQFKPLLKMGIIPDFVLLVDAGTKGVYEQLCEDIPEEGQYTTLITGIHCSPKIVNGWIDQGRSIKFFLSTSPDLQDAFKDTLGKDPDKYKIELGGNVLNGAWMVSLSILQSTVYIALGNDLSYPLHDDIQKRRDDYYADGDYTTNAPETGSGRDEAKIGKKWGGFSLKRKKIITGKDRYDYELDEVGTSHTLWVYKTWLESAMMAVAKSPMHFHYFNCSEAGILGVLSKSEKLEDMASPDNWYMLDSVCPKYHTALFEDAVTTFLKAKEMMEEECRISDAQHVTVSEVLH